MNAPTPFLIRFLLPPLYAALIFCVPIGLTAPVDALKALLVYAIYAYIFAGLPALLFAILLGRFARRRPARNGRLIRATLLGIFSGLLITAMFGFGGAALFLPLGTAVGFLVEGTVVLLERRHVVAA